VAPHIYNDADEIDAAVSTMARLAGEMA
jgi:hypothetical protein